LPDDLKHLEQLLLDMKESLEREMREGFDRIEKAARPRRVARELLLATRHSALVTANWPMATGH
jgi:hypothetical protein